MGRVLIPAEQFRARVGGISEATELRMRKRGTAPLWCRVGARVMYDHDDVERYIEQQLALAGSFPPDKAAA